MQADGRLFAFPYCQRCLRLKIGVTGSCIVRQTFLILAEYQQIAKNYRQKKLRMSAQSFSVASAFLKRVFRPFFALLNVHFLTRKKKFRQFSDKPKFRGRGSCPLCSPRPRRRCLSLSGRNFVSRLSYYCPRKQRQCCFQHHFYVFVWLTR